MGLSECSGHVTGDEKYECVISNVFMKFSRMTFGSVYWESLRGSFLGVLSRKHKTSLNTLYLSLFK